MQVESGLKHGLGSLVEGSGVVYKGSFKASVALLHSEILYHFCHALKTVAIYVAK